MSERSFPMPAVVRTRLWQEAGDMPAYVILDGAQNQTLLGALHADHAPPWRCLFTGQLEPDMVVVAPYLVELEHSSAFTRRLLAEGWGQNWGVFLTSQLALPALWRHVRQQVPVYGPNMESLFLRFYDPRVMRNYLPTCPAQQLAEFFGPVDFYIAEAEEPARAHAWSVAGGKLVAQGIG
jgi:hypothetical protein